MDSCRRASECERVSLSCGVTRVQEPGRGREEGKTGAQTGTHGSAGGACAHAVWGWGGRGMGGVVTWYCRVGWCRRNGPMASVIVRRVDGVLH